MRKTYKEFEGYLIAWRDQKVSLRRAIDSLFLMPQCKVSIMVVTSNFIKDYYNGELDIVTQVGLSRRLNQPVILMLDKDLTPPEKRQTDMIFRDHKVVARIDFDLENIEGSKRELYEALKPYGAKLTLDR